MQWIKLPQPSWIPMYCKHSELSKPCAAASACGRTVCLRWTLETGLESSAPFQLIGRRMALKIIDSRVIYCLHCVFEPLCVTLNNPPAPSMARILPVEQHGSSGDRGALRGIGVFGRIPLLEISRRLASLSSAVRRRPWCEICWYDNLIMPYVWRMEW